MDRFSRYGCPIFLQDAIHPRSPPPGQARNPILNPPWRNPMLPGDNPTSRPGGVTRRPVPLIALCMLMLAATVSPALAATTRLIVRVQGGLPLIQQVCRVAGCTV